MVTNILIITKKYIDNFLKNKLTENVQWQIKRSIFLDLYAHNDCVDIGDSNDLKIDLTEKQMKKISEIISKNVSVSINWTKINNQLEKMEK